jgi:histidine ammonia-lyase
MAVVVTGRDLTVEQLVRVAREGVHVDLAPEALERMAASHAVVEGALQRGDEVYGLSTGVGAKKSARVDADAAPAWNRLLIRNHLVGQGPPLPADVVRAALLRQANHLASGWTGVRPELAQALVESLNDGTAPRVRTYGSIGIADLSSNADLVHGVIPDFPFAAGEALALLDNNAVSTAHSALAIADASGFLDALDVAAALDLEAFASNVAALDPAIADSRPYPGLKTSLERLHSALAGSYLFQSGAARNLQDPLSFRCVPQVHGAARDGLTHAAAQLAVELNAFQANPLVIAREAERIVSVGNFDVLPLAVAVDALRIALAPVLTCAAERTVKLLQRPLTGLPEGLAAGPGLPEDGLAEFGIAVQAIVAEARLLAHPVSFELVSTSQAEGIEDRMTMAPLAARRLAEMVELGARTVAVGLVVAAQALHLRGRPRLGKGTARVYSLVRERVPATGLGEAIPADLEPVVDLVRSGALG